MSVTSSFVVGSHPTIPATTLTVVANAVSEDLVFPGGGYYVDDPTASLSAVAQFATIIATHTQISSCTGSLCQDRLTRFTANIAFTCTFNDNRLRDLLGFTGNLTTSQTTQTGDEPSGYLWVPGKLPLEKGRPGTQGRRKYDTTFGQAGPGQATAQEFNYHVHNEFMFNACLGSRVWNTESNGEFIAFFRNVLKKAYKIKHYRGLTNDEVSSTAVNLGSVTMQGPYILNVGRRDVMEQYEETVEGTYGAEALQDATVPVVGTTEYT